jgi:hypothetical protein
MSSLPPEEEVVNKAIALIMEHWETCQILVTRVEADGFTDSLAKGRGNSLARKGAAQAWLNRADEADRIVVRKDENA